MPNKYYTLPCCGRGTTQPQYSCHFCYPEQFEKELQEDLEWIENGNKEIEKEKKENDTNYQSNDKGVRI
jgi:hypothetical protein